MVQLDATSVLPLREIFPGMARSGTALLYFTPIYDTGWVLDLVWMWWRSKKILLLSLLSYPSVFPGLKNLKTVKITTFRRMDLSSPSSKKGRDTSSVGSGRLSYSRSMDQTMDKVQKTVAKDTSEKKKSCPVRELIPVVQLVGRRVTKCWHP
jgi:hypothetical protein